MEFIKQNRVAIVAVVIVVAIIGLAWLNHKQSDSDKKAAATSSQQAAEKKKQADQKAVEDKKKAEATKNYQYTAQSGDSYTVFARKSVQAYAKANNVSLSKAQIIAAETTLTQNAGAPLLAIGQKVSVHNENLKKAISFAQKLNKSELANWQPYVASVVF